MSETDVVGGFVLPVGIGRERVGRQVGAHGALRSGGTTGSIFEAAFERHEITVGPAVEVDFGDRRRITLELDRSQPGDVRFILVEDETGAMQWILADGVEPAELIVEPDLNTPSERGIVATGAKKVLRWVAMRAPVPEMVVEGLRALEHRVRPSRLVHLAEGSDAPPSRLAPGTAIGGRVLLLIHGTASTTEALLADFRPSQLARLSGGYRHVLAFDHPTLSSDPGENAAALGDQLAALSYSNVELDIVAHGRGGLVARHLIEHGLLPDRIRIGSVVLVATPNGGTPLADRDHALRLVDVLTSPLSALPDNVVTDTLDLALELLKIVAAKLLDSLDGLVAQRPDSAYLTALNQGERDTASYRSVSSAYQGGRDGLGAKLYLRLSSFVFDGDSDLFVPTSSAHGPVGGFHVPAARRLVLRGPEAVTHFGYWQSPAVVDQLLSWLQHAGTDLAGTRSRIDAEAAVLRREAFEHGDMERYRSVVDATTTGDRGAAAMLIDGPLELADTRPGARDSVIVIPGVMGTHLGPGRKRIWIHIARMMFGRLREIAVERDDTGGALRGDVTTMGLVSSYEDLVAHLLQRRHVSLFGYDWRLSLALAADELNARVVELRRGRRGRPLTFVAHSMGGLVLRTFIDRHPETWAELGPEARAVLLGTPNGGSHSMVRNLVGDDPKLRYIAALSPLSLAETTQVVQSMPGVYQLLPRVGDDGVDLLADATWGSILHHHLGRVSKPHQARVAANLADARSVLGALDAQLDSPDFADDDRLFMIAGTGHETTVATQVGADGELSWQADRNGDGTVPLALAEFPGGRATYYAPASHSGLAEDRAVFRAIDELLATGATTELSSTYSPSKRSAESARRSPRFGVAPESYVQPVVDEAALLEASVWLPSGHSARATLGLSVVHASLEQARFPVMVGHYRGIAVEGAERFLNSRLDGKLIDAYELGEYPEGIGENLVVRPEDSRPEGGIVVGLGNFGELTMSKLARSVRSAALEYIRRRAVRGGDGVAGLSTVLIGSPGQHDLTIDQSIEAITTGVLQANQRIDAAGANGTSSYQRITELEFIEYYGDKADEALGSLQDVPARLSPAVIGDVELKVADMIATAEGGVERTTRPRERDRGWLRYRIKRPDGLEATGYTGVSRIEISAEGRAARSAIQDVELDFTKFDAKIAGSDDRSQRWRRSVVADLIPTALREEFAEADNLHLLLDKDMARVPWEMLADRADGHGGQALSLRGGVVREFIDREPTSFAHTPGETKRALVIGNPLLTDPAFGSLAGAEREALLVAELLSKRGYEVELLVGEQADWLSVDVAFKSADASIIHIAAHGMLHPGDEDRTGIVLSDGQLLKAVDFEKIAKPDLVFLNACHVGSMGRLSLSQPDRFAATFAERLFRTDVRAVVAAGWAVDDNAALRFAETFYERMLRHDSFGTATKLARSAAFYSGGPDSLTWAAYQCYGKPGFALPGGQQQGGSTDRRHYVSPRDFRLDLEQVVSRADTTWNLERIGQEVQELEEIYRRRLRSGDRFPGLTCELLGEAHRSSGRFEDAIRCFDEALHDIEASSSVKAVERRGNVRSRYAVELIRTREGGDLPTWTALKPMFDQALADLNTALALSPTPKRLMLLAGHHRRAAYARSAVGRPSEAVRKQVAGWLNESIDAALTAYEQRGEIYELTGIASSWALLKKDEQKARARRRRDADQDVVTSDWLSNRLDEWREEAQQRADRAGPTDAWRKQDLANVLLAQLMLDPRANNVDVDVDVIADNFTQAWRFRSNAAQRRSAVDHVRLMAGLATDTVLKRRMQELDALLDVPTA